MAQGPPLPATPLELLTNKGLVEEPYLNKFWGPVLVGGMGFLGVCVGNWHAARPMLAGLQRHLMYTAGGAVAGKYIDDYRVKYYAERDAVLRHYIQLHPEDFPPYQRKKFSEVLVPWIPIR